MVQRISSVGVAGVERGQGSPKRAWRRLSVSAIGQRLKSAILTPVGTVTSLFGHHGTVALTFDDGPDEQVTPRILDVLRRHGAKATFFVLTDQAIHHQDLLNRMIEAGHEIGLHFDCHDRIPSLAPWTAWRRMKAARDRLAELTGRVVLFRPPYGSQNYITYGFAKLLRMRVVGWSQCANDWIEQSPESSARSALQNLTGGDIILMHDGLALPPGEPRPRLDRAEVTDLVLAGARARGLNPVTVSALLRQGPHRLSHWFR
jgi:peptidoglycan/xylan/chitin deacetylase (PgdA/CDA1 family)